jgi:hypothetical protein
MLFGHELFPVANAQTFQGIAKNITGVLDSIIPILVLIATIVFIWGIILYVIAGGDENKLQQARNYIIWGIIGLFVIISVWGLVLLLIKFIFGTGGLPPALPLPNIPGTDPSPLPKCIDVIGPPPPCTT